MLPQWHIKDPGHSAKSADGRLHLNTLSSLTKRSRSGLTMSLSRHSVGIYHKPGPQAQGGQSSQPAEPLWTDPGLKSGISVNELISTKNKQTNKTWAGIECSNLLQKSSQALKELPPPPPNKRRRISRDGSDIGSCGNIGDKSKTRQENCMDLIHEKFNYVPLAIRTEL